MTEHDFKMACAKFQGNRFRNDGKIDKNHALQHHQNNCVPDYRGQPHASAPMLSSVAILSQCAKVTLMEPVDSQN